MSKKESKKVEPKKKQATPPAPEVKSKPQPEVEDQTDFEGLDPEPEQDEDPEGLEAAAAKGKIKFRCATCGAKYETADQLEFKDDQGKEHSYCPNCFQKWIHRFVSTLQPWSET